MKNSQIIKEREKVIRRRLITFFIAVVVTFIVITGSNIVNDGKRQTLLNAMSQCRRLLRNTQKVEKDLI